VKPFIGFKHSVIVHNYGKWFYTVIVAIAITVVVIVSRSCSAVKFHKEQRIL